ncbi:MAG TPA: hypothetical protein VFJ46_17685 [Xanthobacteraceae bacterium]|nr:hypothetical protein [Xanthobacteraceae bacterium]
MTQRTQDRICHAIILAFAIVSTSLVVTSPAASDRHAFRSGTNPTAIVEADRRAGDAR